MSKLSKTKILDYVSSYGDGIHGTPIYDSEGKYFFINGNNLKDGNIEIYLDTKKINEIEFDRIKRNLSERTILVSINGSLGNIAIYKGEPVALGKSACFLNIKINKNLYFCKYVLETKLFKNYISLVSTGSTIKNLSPSQVVDYEFWAPSEEQQEKISNVLRNIDLKIQNNKKQIENLESLAKTIYDYWFVQFDFPNEDGKPYKSSGGKMVWNEELKREIPAGWEKSFFNQLVSSQVSGDWGKESIINNHKHQIYCIRGTDFASINSSENSDIPVRYILEKNLDKRLSYGDIIIEVSGGSPTQSTGRISYITNDLLNRFDKPVLVSNFCKALRLKEPKDVFWFYHTWSRLYSSGVFFNFESKTTGIKNLMLDPVLTDLGVVIPPVFYREKFYKLVAPFYSRIQKIKSENQQLFSLKVYLLPLLMNGQVKVGKVSA